MDNVRLFTLWRPQGPITNVTAWKTIRKGWYRCIIDEQFEATTCTPHSDNFQLLINYDLFPHCQYKASQYSDTLTSVFYEVPKGGMGRFCLWKMSVYVGDNETRKHWTYSHPCQLTLYEITLALGTELWDRILTNGLRGDRCSITGVGLESS